MKYWYILIIASILSACESLPKVDPPKHRQPKSDAARLYLRDDTTIRDEGDLRALASKLDGSKVYKSGDHWVWDLNGGMLRGDKQSGDGGQSEDQEPLIRVKMPLVIKDGFVRNNKDALTFYDVDSGCEKMTWLNVGEDAVATFKGAYRFHLKDCEFVNNREGDKSIQLNEARDAVIEDCLVFSGITGARVGSSGATKPSEEARARGNHFIGVDTCYNVSSITLDVDEKTEKYEKVRLKFKTSNGAKVE